MKSKFPKCMEQHRLLTNVPLTMMEFLEAICKQKKGKGPGPDGLLEEYYQKFENIPSGNLKYMILEILDENEIPDPWRYSTTTLIPKEGESKDDILNYRPIALLNADYKIFAMLKAVYSRKILTTLILHNQNVFLL